MNIISIDTCSDTAAVTAYGSNGKYTSIFLPSKTRLTAHLLSLIENSIHYAGFNAKETNTIICSQGPGSFTGLRLAYSTAKSIQLVSNCNFYCVSMLDLIAYQYKNKAEQVLAVIDAKRDCFYVQAFQNDKPMSQPFDIPAEDAIALLDINKTSIICGFGVDKFYLDLNKILPEKTILIDCLNTCFSQVMLDYFLSGKDVIPVNEFDGPMYIRKSDAEK